MRTVDEVIRDGDWCIGRTGNSYLISVEDWQTLKAAVLAQQTNNSSSLQMPSLLEAVSGALGFKVSEVPGTDTGAAMADMYNYIATSLRGAVP